MSWRKIEVDGHTYRWRGGGYVIVQDENGKRVVCAHMAEIKGISHDAFERGRHKKTSDGMLGIKELADYIRKVKTND